MKYFIVFLALAGGRFVHSGYIYDKGLGNECLYDEDCITRNSFCKGNKICACKIGYQYDPGSDVCFPKEVNLRCSEDYDCSALQNARCEYGKCQCKHDFVASADRSYCLPSMRLTSTCQEDIQCSSVMNHSHCDRDLGQCICDRGLRRDSYRMLCVEEVRLLHTKCMTTAECEKKQDLVGKVVCRPTDSSLVGTCECAAGYIEKDDTCEKDGSSQIALSLPAIVVLVLAKWLV